MAKDADMQELKMMVRDIHTAMFGHKGQEQEGVFAITRANQKDIARLQTQAKTIWAVIIALPIVGGVLALFGYLPVLPERGEVHR